MSTQRNEFTLLRDNLLGQRSIDPSQDFLHYHDLVEAENEHLRCREKIYTGDGESMHVHGGGSCCGGEKTGRDS